MREGTRVVGWAWRDHHLSRQPPPATGSATLYADGSIVVRSAPRTSATGNVYRDGAGRGYALGMPASRVRFELGDSVSKAPGSGRVEHGRQVLARGPGCLCGVARAHPGPGAARQARVRRRGACRPALRERCRRRPVGRVRVAELLAAAGPTRSREASASRVTRDRYFVALVGAQFAEVRSIPTWARSGRAATGLFDAGAC